MKKTIRVDIEVVLEPDEEAGGFVVTVPALSGCFTQGATEEEALANAKEAIELYLESVAEDTGEL